MAQTNPFTLIIPNLRSPPYDFASLQFPCDISYALIISLYPIAHSIRSIPITSSYQTNNMIYNTLIINTVCPLVFCFIYQLVSTPGPDVILLLLSNVCFMTIKWHNLFGYDAK